MAKFIFIGHIWKFDAHVTKGNQKVLVEWAIYLRLSSIYYKGSDRTYDLAPGTLSEWKWTENWS